MDRNTDFWMVPVENEMGRLSIARTNSFILDTPTNIRIDGDETDPDFSVYVIPAPDPALATINIFHPEPMIPPTLTPTGTLIVYTLREQLSRSPPPIPVRDMEDVEFRCYYHLLRHRFHDAMQNLKRADAELERGPRAESPLDGRLIRDVPVSERRSIALSIVRGLRLLQTHTARPPETCLLCDRLPAPGREPEAIPEDSSDLETHTLRVQCRKFFRFGRFTEIKLIDGVSILPPILEDDENSTPMLCKFHRYIFQYLMYKVVSPSWPVPHLQQDVDAFGEGEVAVASWNPDAQMWQTEQPRQPAPSASLFPEYL